MVNLWLIYGSATQIREKTWKLIEHIEHTRNCDSRDQVKHIYLFHLIPEWLPMESPTRDFGSAFPIAGMFVQPPFVWVKIHYRIIPPIPTNHHPFTKCTMHLWASVGKHPTTSKTVFGSLLYRWDDRYWHRPYPSESTPVSIALWMEIQNMFMIVFSFHQWPSNKTYMFRIGSHLDTSWGVFRSTKRVLLKQGIRAPKKFHGESFMQKQTVQYSNFMAS